MPPMGPTSAGAVPPWQQPGLGQRPMTPPQGVPGGLVQGNVTRQGPGYPEEGQPLPRPRARRTGYFGPQAQPGSEGADDAEWSVYDLQKEIEQGRSGRQGRRRGPEPLVDDISGPRTRPMFADDDEPANGLDLDEFGRNRRR